MEKPLLTKVKAFYLLPNNLFYKQELVITQHQTECS